jgi:hypothetical protein
LAGLEKAQAVLDRAGAIARGARCFCAPLRFAAALAGPARFCPIDIYGQLHAIESVHEANAHGVEYVFAPLRRWAAPPLLAEAEKFSKAAKVEAPMLRPPLRAKSGGPIGVSKCVEVPPFFLVRQDFMGFRYFFELGFALCVSRVKVRVVLPRQLPVRFLNVVFGRALWDAKGLVVVGRCHSDSLT